MDRAFVGHAKIQNLILYIYIYIYIIIYRMIIYIYIYVYIYILYTVWQTVAAWSIFQRQVSHRHVVLFALQYRVHARTAGSPWSPVGPLKKPTGSKICSDENPCCCVYIYIYNYIYGYGSIPIFIPFLMNIHKCQLNFDVNYRGTRFWHTPIHIYIYIYMSSWSRSSKY